MNNYIMFSLIVAGSGMINGFAAFADPSSIAPIISQIACSVVAVGVFSG